MRWIKRGRIFQVEGQFQWMSHHSSVPLPDLVDQDRLRIYFAARDDEGRSRPGFIDTDPADPSKHLRLHDKPVLELGGLGTFDDSGIMPACIVQVGAEKYLYYVGWNRSVTVPYSLAIGLAVSADGGVSFNRMHTGPIIDRSPLEPYLALSCFVLVENGTWRMWYGSGTGWVEVKGRPEPLYEIKYAESRDGLRWQRENVTCIAPNSPSEAIGRPWVVRNGDLYRMWYSYRDSVDYRTDPAQSYRIGYAESRDGLRWDRLDGQVGIECSNEGWDSQMIEYAGVYRHAGATHMIYAGNGFGESGIGHAVLGSS